MQEKKDRTIMIPEGHFGGYCDSCFYGKRKQKDAQGRILCTGEPGGYRVPDEKNECQHYTGRVTTWIKIAVGVYLLITALAVIIEVLT